MKKYMIAAGFALLGLTNLNAQDIAIGAKAGVNLSNVMGDDVEDASMKIGIFGGAYANLGLTEKIFFQPELLYSMQGAETDNPEATVSFDYLNIPLMFQYGVTENIRVEVGPQVGILLSAESEVGNLTLDVKDVTKSVDFGINLGGVYYMDNGLNFTVRYALGLTTTSDPGETTVGDITIEAEEADVKNGVLSIGVGYSIL